VLSAQGPVGQAVEGLVASNNANSNGTSGSSGRKGSGGNGSGVGAQLFATGSGPISGLLNPLLSGSSSGGLGLLLPIFLLTVLVLALGVVALRRNGSSSGPQA
jgi:hypothetical protein